MWLFIPEEHAIYKNMLSTPAQATSAVMTCRIILNLREYGKKEVVAADGKSVSLGVVSSMSPEKSMRGNPRHGPLSGRDGLKSATKWNRLRLQPSPKSSSSRGTDGERGAGGMTFAARQSTTVTTTTYSQVQSAPFGVDECVTTEYGGEREYAEDFGRQSEDSEGRKYVYDHGLTTYEKPKEKEWEPTGGEKV